MRPEQALMDRDHLKSKHALVCGVGNIGSHLVMLLAQMGIGRITIVDRDRQVEARNLLNQVFHPKDVGRPKAIVIGERLRRQFPELIVEEHVADLEGLPLGRFTVDVCLAGLDSRLARQRLISAIAWPLGVPIIDGGVGDGLVGRVQVFVPGPASACLECTWNQADYREASAEFPCHPERSHTAPPTAAPALTGSAVASLMAAECLRLLSGSAEAESTEIAFDLGARRFLTSKLRRAGGCRFDHEVVAETIPLDRELPAATIDDLLAAVVQRFGDEPLHLEFRRGLMNGPMGPHRHVSPAWLRQQSPGPLARFGLLAEDRIRVRGAKRSAYIVGAGARRAS